MNVKTQKFLVFGVSKSGLAVSKYILGQNGKCSIYEELKSEKIEESISALKELGAKVLDEETVFDGIKESDVVIVSPGVPINHELLIFAKKTGKRIVGELEFAFGQFLPLTVAVTGTNGKTTTVNMIGSILSETSTDYKLVGNVGIPVSSVIDDVKKDEILVTEVSSFQLESIKAFCPHVGCFLNFSPDHLERHYNEENYLFLKKRLFSNMTESEYAVLNYDDQTIREFASELKSKIVWVSLKEKVKGAYRYNGDVFFDDEYVLSEKDVNVFGDHNVFNMLFAISVCKILGYSNDVILRGLKKFKCMKHRLEMIKEIDGVKYFNDSKATNTASTITAIENMKNPTVLILGGSEKGENYDLLFKKVKESFVKHVVITGASRFNMLDSASKQGISELTMTENFNVAVKISKAFAEKGDNVLLSPACASFDLFKSYEERGDVFRKIVESFVE